MILPISDVAEGRGGTWNEAGVILFGTLKTIADVLMHWVEYRITAASASAADLSSLPESRR